MILALLAGLQDIPETGLLKVYSWIILLESIVILSLIFGKSNLFRPVAILITLSGVPITIMLGISGFVGADSLISSTVGALLACAIWVPYLQVSRRVRVTFEHMVRANEVPASSEPPTRQEPQVGYAPESQVTPAKKPASATIAATPQVSNVVNGPSSNEAAWAQALEEFEGNDRRRGLWAKSFAEANGDETRAKVLYLKARAHEIDQAERVATAERVARESRPMGTCPNSSCWAVIPMDSSECPHCGEKFDGDAHPLLRA